MSLIKRHQPIEVLKQLIAEHDRVRCVFDQLDLRRFDNYFLCAFHSHLPLLHLDGDQVVPSNVIINPLWLRIILSGGLASGPRSFFGA